MSTPPQQKPGQTFGNNQPVGNAGQSQGFPFAKGNNKSKNSDAKNAAIERRMKRHKKGKK